MARINYPEDFVKQVTLFENVKKKHDKDGAESPLNAFLAEQKIDLEADSEAATKAFGTNTRFLEISKMAEDETQDRNNFFNPVFDNVKKSFQFLKKFYVGNPAELGKWGATVNGNAIVYPPDFGKRVQLFRDMKKKHDSFEPGKSPLQAFLTQNEIDLEKDEKDAAAAEENHAAAKQAEKDAEDFREKRDKLFDPVLANVRKIGQFLKGLYVSNPKNLGHWGYVIDDSPRDPKFRTTAIPAAGSRTLTGVKQGSQLENTGPVDLLLHKGEEIGPGFVRLQPEMPFTIERGWGTTTVENPDASEEGEVGWLTVDG